MTWRELIDDEDVAVTPTASKIPLADGSGKIALGWLPTGTLSSTVALGDEPAAAVAAHNMVDDPHNAGALVTAHAAATETHGITALGAAWNALTTRLAQRNALGVFRVWDDLSPPSLNNSIWTAKGSGSGAGGGGFEFGAKTFCRAADVIGVARAVTGSGSAGTEGGIFYHNQFSNYLADGSVFIFRMLLNRATTIGARWGLRNDIPATGPEDVTDGLYFDVMSSVDATNVRVCSASASTRTKGTTTYAISNLNQLWVYFKIEFLNGTSGAKFFYLNGTTWTQIGSTITTNLPAVGTTRTMRAFAQAFYDGGTFGEVYIDSFGVSEVTDAGVPPNPGA